MSIGERDISLFATLSEVVQAANSTLDSQVILELIMDKVKVVVEAEGWSILLKEDAHLVFVKTAGAAAETLQGVQLSLDKGVAGRVATTGEPVVVNTPGDHPDFLQEVDQSTGFKTSNLLAVPLRARSGILGVVEFVNKKGGFSRDDMDKVQLFLDPLAMALDNAYLFKRTQDLTITDDLTGLFNSRYVIQTLGREVERCRRYQSQFSLLFLDLDGFKAVNDTHGHLVGSRTLTQVGAVIQTCIREVDVAARYGGDEFTILLPSTSIVDSTVVAHRIRNSIRNHDWTHAIGHAISISASVGIASCPNHGLSSKEILAAADRAMYKVKEEGKNGVSVAPEVSQ